MKARKVGIKKGIFDTPFETHDYSEKLKTRKLHPGNLQRSQTSQFVRFLQHGFPINGDDARTNPLTSATDL